MIKNKKYLSNNYSNEKNSFIYNNINFIVLCNV